jgi:hypothetical protein
LKSFLSLAGREEFEKKNLRNKTVQVLLQVHALLKSGQHGKGSKKLLVKRSVPQGGLFLN